MQKNIADPKVMKAQPMLYANRYQILTEIGNGSMGIVYAAVDLLMGNPVALKVVTAPADQLTMRKSVAHSDLDSFLALAHEFRILACLRHPHIISVLDYGFDAEQQPFFTMDLLENPQTILEAGWEQDRNAKIQLLIQLLQALSYLHRHGVVHRDLKPSNILVQDGQVRVLDFGLAVEHGDVANIAGTLAYIAPELLHYQVPTTASDLYAVGVIAYELFVGHHPFNLTNSNTLLRDVFWAEVDLSVLEGQMVGDAPLPQSRQIARSKQVASTVDATLLDGDYRQLLAHHQSTIAPNNDGQSPLARIVGRLLQKDPAHRYADAADVIRDLNALLDVQTEVEPSAIRESFLAAAKFIGRAHELSKLTDALDWLKEPHQKGSAWAISGESGVGKSRLLDELRIRALVDGIVVLRGQGVNGGEFAYQLWRHPLRRLVLSTEISESEIGVLKQIIPDIESLIGHEVGDLPPIDNDDLKQRLIDTIVGIFARQLSPILLLLEDLQWAQASLDLLQRLVQLVEDVPLLIVVTYRYDEAPHLSETLNAMQSIRLGRFEDSAIAELSYGMLGEVGRHPSILKFLTRETEGNAFFVVEVARALAENAESLRDIDPSILPERIITGDILDLIQRRLDRVPQWGQALLKLGAIQGRVIEMPIMEGIYHASESGEQDEHTLENWLFACADAVVLEIYEGEWRFCHDKIREYLIDNIVDKERSRLYHQVAEVVEQLYGEEAAYAAKLADLWTTAGNIAQELHYVRLAGQHAMEFSAYHDAIRLLERALLLTSKHSDDRDQIARLMWQLGRSNYHIGDYEAAQRYYASSFEHYEALNMHEGMAENLEGLAWIAMYQGNFERANESFTQSLTLFEAVGHQGGIARVYNGLGDIARNQADFDLAEDFHHKSLVIERERGNHYGVAFSLHFLGMVNRSRGDYEAAHRYYSESLSIRRELGDQAKIGISLANLGVVAYRHGHFEAALQQIEEGIAIFDMVGNRQGQAVLGCFLADAYMALGNIETATQYLNQSLSLAIQIGSLPAKLRAAVIFARLRLAQDQPKAGFELLGMVLNHPDRNAEVQMDAARSVDEYRGTFPKEQIDEWLAIGASFILDDVLNDLLVTL